MNRLTRTWIRNVGTPVMLAIGLVALLSAQAPTVAELRSQLTERYDVVALQRGVALVPRGRDSKVRMIQVVDGVVSVDGETLTGRQLRDALGRDAALVVQISYLDPAAQRQLTTAATAIEPAASAPAAPAPETESNTAPSAPTPNVRHGDIVRIATGGVTVSQNERVDGDVVSILGGADIDGEVTHDVTVIAGPLTLGPHAVVRGDVTAVGGQVRRDPAARVSGSINEVGIGSRHLHDGVFSPAAPVFGLPFMFPSQVSRAVRFTGVVGTLLRVLLLVVLTLVVIAVARPAIDRVGEHAAANPARAGVAGFLAELLFVPALIAIVIVLAVSIVGIPMLLLVPFAVGAFLVLMLVGFTGAAFVVGTRLAQRFGFTDAGPFLTVALGVAGLAAFTLLAKLAGVIVGGFIGLPLVAVGYLIEYLAWTIGLGAVILAWLDRRRPATTVPAVPAVVV